MGKISNRERILTEGLKVVHQQGFTGASVRDIVSAAGVPQGSFTNHFASKEAFGLEILDLYYAQAKQVQSATLGDRSVDPLLRIRNWISALKGAIEQGNMKIGCMLGNFSAEVTKCDGAIRLRLTRIFTDLQTEMASCLQDAVNAGELPEDTAIDEIAGFIISSMQGAILLSKAHRHPLPIDQFAQVLFSKVLI